MAGSGLLAKGAPPMPIWVTYMRYAILGLSLVILAIAAYGVAILGGGCYLGYCYSGAGGLVIFVCILTFLVYGGATAVEIWAPHLFFRIAFLIGFIFSVIFWLSGWGWAASSAAFWLAYTYGYSFDTREGSAMAACAGLGAVVWVMCIVNLVFFVKACISNGAGAGQAELGNIKHQEPGAGYPGPQYPAQQQTYPQQTYPAQPYGQPQQQQQQPYGQQPYAPQ
jgi:hypothetical protein